MTDVPPSGGPVRNLFDAYSSLIGLLVGVGLKLHFLEWWIGSKGEILGHYINFLKLPWLIFFSSLGPRANLVFLNFPLVSLAKVVP